MIDAQLVITIIVLSTVKEACATQQKAIQKKHAFRNSIVRNEDKKETKTGPKTRTIRV